MHYFARVINKMMIKAIIFDLDGTLLNTAPDIQRVLNASLAKFSMPPVSMQKLHSILGDGAYNLVWRALPEDKKDLADAVLADYAPAYAACDNSLTQLYPGEDEALTRLKAAGVKLAVLSNKPQDATSAVYNAKLSKYGFDVVLGQGRFALKPSPEGTEYIISSLGLKKEECLFTGDGETDVRTAQNAGLPCISVLWGFRKKEQLAAAGATLFAENYTDYLHILQEKFLLNA